MKRKREDVDDVTDFKFAGKIIEKKEYNTVLDFLKLCQKNLTSNLLEEGEYIFCHFFTKNLLKLPPPQNPTNDDQNQNQALQTTLSLTQSNKSGTKQQFETWLLQKYNFYITFLLTLIFSHKPSNSLRVNILNSLFQFMFFEYYFMRKKIFQTNEKTEKVKFELKNFEDLTSHKGSIMYRMINTLLIIPNETLKMNNGNESMKRKKKKVKPSILIINYMKKNVSKFRDMKYVLFNILTDLFSKSYDNSQLSLSFNNLLGLIDKLTFITHLSSQNTHTFESFMAAKFSHNEKNGKLYGKIRHSNTNVTKKRKLENFFDIEMEVNLCQQKFENFYIKFFLQKSDFFTIPVKYYKFILLRMNAFIIPNFKHPLLLSDFIISLFKRGGYISLLCIRSIFILMSKHNMAYKTFYYDLYNMLNLNILKMNYKNDFLQLIYDSLCSSKVPLYIVSSFIKKFSRLSLYSSPNNCVYIIYLIYNIIKKYKELSILIHRKDEILYKEKKKNLFDTVLFVNFKKEKKKEEEEEVKKMDVFMGNDPYDINEKDLQKTKAMESCLWELQAMSNHCVIQVSNEYKNFKYNVKNGFKKNMKLHEAIEESYDTLFEKNLPKNFEEEEIIPNFHIQETFLKFGI